MAKMLLTGGTPLARMGVLLGITATLGTFASVRFKHAGDWLPDNVPQEVGVWQGVDTPISKAILASLGAPQAIGRKYVNALGEEVYVSIISAGAFENYHDPTVCVAGNGFLLTGKRNFLLDGPKSGEVRAMVFRQINSSTGAPVRILMYYWQQNRDATTATEPVMGNYRDILARFRTGFGAVVQGHQTCLVRVYTFLDPDDEKGVQTQRNVEEISKALYRALKENGESQS